MAKGRGVSRGLNTGAAQVIRGIPQVDYAGQREEELAKEAAKRPKAEDVGELAEIDAIPEDVLRYQDKRKIYQDGLIEYEQMEDKYSPEAMQKRMQLNKIKSDLQNFAEITVQQKDQYNKYVQQFFDNPKYDQENVEDILVQYQEADPFTRLEMERGGLRIPNKAPLPDSPWHPNFVKEVEASITDVKNEEGYETIQQVYADPAKTKEIVKSWVENNKNFSDRGGGVIERFEIPKDQAGNIQWESEQGQIALEELTNEMVNRAGTKTSRTEDEKRAGLNFSFGGGSYSGDKYTYDYTEEKGEEPEDIAQKINIIGGEAWDFKTKDEAGKALKEGNESIWVGRTDASENKPLKFVTGEQDDDGNEVTIEAIPLGVTKKDSGEPVIVVVQEVTGRQDGNPAQYKKREIPYTDANKGKIANEYKYRDPETKKYKNFNYDEMVKLFKGNSTSIKEGKEQDPNRVRTRFSSEEDVYKGDEGWTEENPL